MSSIGLQEPLISKEDMARLQEMRKGVMTAVQGYRHQFSSSSATDPSFSSFSSSSSSSSGRREPHHRNWRVGNEKFQFLMDESNEFGNHDLALPFANNWSIDISPLDTDWPDTLLYQYYIATDRKLGDAIEKFVSMLIWREESCINELSLIPCLPYHHVKRSLVSNTYTHTSQHGHVVLYGKIGIVNVDQMMKLLSLDEARLTHIWWMEWQNRKLHQLSTSTGKTTNQLIYVVDFAGARVSQLKFLSYMKALSNVNNDYYPEMMYRLFIVNAPHIFPYLWKVLKAFLPATTKRKIHLYGTQGYQQKLCELIGKEKVPREYGGECDCKGKDKECLESLKPIPNYCTHSNEYDETAAKKKIKQEFEIWADKAKIDKKQYQTIFKEYLQFD